MSTLCLLFRYKYDTLEEWFEAALIKVYSCIIH